MNEPPDQEHPLSEKERPHDPVGYAVVGLGWISQAAMLPAFANAEGGASLRALVSGKAEKRRKVAGLYGLSESDTYAYDDFEACLDRDDVEAVYLAVPNALHREYTERAAAKGVHVLCEKPMAVTDDECRAMIRATEAAGVKLMIAYRLHFDPANLAAVERVRQGAIGESRIFSSTFTQQVRGGDIRLVPVEEGGGPLFDIGIYCINASRYLFRAEPVSVWATQASRPQERFGEVSEAVSCVLRFPGERLAAFTCSFGAHAVSDFRLVGDDGDLRLENAYDFTGERRLSQRGGSERDGGETTFPELDQFGPQLTYFSRCVREDRQPEPDGEEGRIDVRIIRALHRSLEEDRRIDVELGRDRRPMADMAMEYEAVAAPELVKAEDPSS